MQFAVVIPGDDLLLEGRFQFCGKAAVQTDRLVVAPKQEVVGPGVGGIAAQSFQQELPGEEVVEKEQELDDL